MNISLPDSLKAFVDEQVKRRGRGKAASWLSRPNRALGHVTPLRVLARGRRQEVLDVLGRILHGIPS